MPKWLIILLIVFLVFFLGCCGGWVACNWMCAQVSHTVGAGVTAGLEAATREAEARMRAETQRMAEEAARDATREGGAPGGGGGGGGGGAGGAGEGGGAVPGAIAKLPDNFPADLPFYSGLTPRFSTFDKVNGIGAVKFEGKGEKGPVVSFYEKEMEKQGWKIEQNVDTGTGALMVFSKNSRKVTMQLSSEQGNITGTIVYESRQ